MALIDLQELRNTLGLAQSAISGVGHLREDVKIYHIRNLQVLIDEIDNLQPRSNEIRECEDDKDDIPGGWAERSPVDGRHRRNGHVLFLDATEKWKCDKCGHAFNRAMDGDAYSCGEKPPSTFSDKGRTSDWRDFLSDY